MFHGNTMKVKAAGQGGFTCEYLQDYLKSRAIVIMRLFYLLIFHKLHQRSLISGFLYVSVENAVVYLNMFNVNY